MNYYEELGIRSDADEEEIRKAHRRLVKLMHPDQHRDAGLKALAETQMRRLNSIVATLLDPDERREYDEQLRGGGGDPLNPPPPQSSWKAVPWWIASTLGAIILTVGTLWFFADRMGSTRTPPRNPPPDVANIAPNDTTSTVTVPVPVPAQTPSVKPPDEVTTVPVPTPQQVPNTTKSEEKKPEPAKPEPPKPEPPKPAPVVKTPELAKATKPPEPVIRPLPPPVVKETVKKLAVAPQKPPVIATPRQTSAQLKPPVATHQPPPYKAPVTTPPSPPTTVAVAPREEKGPIVSTPPPTPPVPTQPKEPVVIATANPPATAVGSSPARETSPPDIPKATSTPTPAVATNYRNNHDPLEGEWVYAPTEPEKRKPGFFPPQFIQLKLVKDPNGMHGEYSAHYLVDKPVSPDVNFVVKATDPTAMKYIWTAPNGAHGWLMIVDLETDMMRLEWKDTGKHNGQQLTSGQATLVRKN